MTDPIDTLVELAQETEDFAATSRKEKKAEVDILGKPFEYRFRVTAAGKVREYIPLLSRRIAIRVNPVGRGGAEWYETTVEMGADDWKIESTIWDVTAEAIQEAAPYRDERWGFF